MHVVSLQVYFGGGSVSLATPEGCWHALKCNPADALTDGTPDFLGAAALNEAFNWWDNTLGGMQVRLLGMSAGGLGQCTQAGYVNTLHPCGHIV